MTIIDLDKKIKDSLKKEQSEKKLWFDFQNCEFMGVNMALRNKTSNSIFGSLDKKRQREKNDED